jgi:protein-L-isoaspartate(D-aspartate) O-methyltransferase
MNALEVARREFAEKIRSLAALRSTRLVEALATVPREQFVGPGPWLLANVPDGYFSGPSPAPLQRPVLGRGYQLTPDDDPRRLYENVLVALDPERSLNNGEPAFLARCLDALDLSPGERFLHLGCGVGYYTAIAAHAVSGGTVLALEVDAGLAGRATLNLASFADIEVRRASEVDPRDGPFDAIFVNAGATEVREPWLDQLRIGGRLLVPLTVAIPESQLGAGHMLLVQKRATPLYPARFVMPVGIFHCTGARTEDGDALLRSAFPRGVDAVQSLRRDPHVADDECWLHVPGHCLSLRPPEPAAPEVPYATTRR